MTISDVMTNFINDARFRVAQIGIELDLSSHPASSKHYRDLESKQLQLIQFLDCIYVDRLSFIDGHINFLNWTDEAITRETEYLRYFCEIGVAPVTPLIPFSPYLYSGSGSVSSSGSSKGAWVSCGNCDLSSNLFPSTGGTGAGGAIVDGNIFYNTKPSTTLVGSDGGIIAKGTLCKANTDNPGQAIANWTLIYTQI